MPELTNEQLAEIEAARLSLAVDEDALQVIDALIAEIRRLWAQYDELRDALCSKAWAPRDNHEQVVALAKMMKRRESKIEAARDGGGDD